MIDQAEPQSMLRNYKCHSSTAIMNNFCAKYFFCLRINALNAITTPESPPLW